MQLIIIKLYISLIEYKLLCPRINTQKHKQGDNRLLLPKQIKIILFSINRMKPNPLFQPIVHSVEIKNTARWSIYHRLQELEIPCKCSTDRPLQVELNYPNAIAQLCSVVKQSTASRSELIQWLNRCWKSKTRRQKSQYLGD